MGEEIGRKISDRRKLLGLTLEEVANEVGVGRSTVRKWENGMIKNMGRDKIQALAKVLQINPIELVSTEVTTDMLISRYMAESYIKKHDELADTYQMKRFPRHKDIDVCDSDVLTALHGNEQLSEVIHKIVKMNPADIDKLSKVIELMFSKEGKA